ncbi:hypothetical protein N657DRAFT_644197 [Parathielavia appendiculata]|uniref:Uncharacterized protein n=1 Tax=Parathielavia appendiculata TaxID=2587402 RepID=A0AAN6U372_9PEZI|nr:hypothetical protein N657DRAFT_644197 [Parathielavia appendiculata]
MAPWWRRKGRGDHGASVELPEHAPTTRSRVLGFLANRKGGLLSGLCIRGSPISSMYVCLRLACALPRTGMAALDLSSLGFRTQTHTLSLFDRDRAKDRRFLVYIDKNGNLREFQAVGLNPLHLAHGVETDWAYVHTEEEVLHKAGQVKDRHCQMGSVFVKIQTTNQSMGFRRKPPTTT